MASQAIIFLLLGIIILFLIAINAFLLWYFRQTNKKIDDLLEKGNIKDFKDILLSQKTKNDGIAENIKELFRKSKALEDICETTIRKTSMIRFNPFNEMGGNQSFIVALLDDKNNGFLISSLFSNDGNRVYAKTVKDGKSEYTLSKEEVEAIEKAINFK